MAYKVFFASQTVFNINFFFSIRAIRFHSFSIWVGRGHHEEFNQHVCGGNILLYANHIHRVDVYIKEKVRYFILIFHFPLVLLYLSKQGFFIPSKIPVKVFVECFVKKITDFRKQREWMYTLRRKWDISFWYKVQNKNCILV